MIVKLLPYQPAARRYTDAKSTPGLGRNNPGMTLIELMIAMVIIGILSALLLPVVGRARAGV